MLKELVTSVAFSKSTTVLNISETQINHENILIDLDCLLKNGFITNLLLQSEQDIIDKHILPSLTPKQLSSGIPQEILVFNECSDRIKFYLKSIMCLTPNGKILKEELKNY
jgi:hypothetical protein